MYTTDGGHFAHQRDNTVEFKLYGELGTDMKTWPDAEAHCQREGGHLASVLTEEEKKYAMAASGGLSVWLGGTDQEKEGRWMWTDQSPWDYKQWNDMFGSLKYGNMGEKFNCLLMDWFSKDWKDLPCHIPNPFLCQLPALQITGKNNITLNYTREQLSFSSFIVDYSYH